jgi:hypothetical protein
MPETIVVGVPATGAAQAPVTGMLTMLLPAEAPVGLVPTTRLGELELVLMAIPQGCVVVPKL